LANKAIDKQYKGKHLLVDTNIHIYQLNGSRDLSDELASASGIYISAISVAELFAGVQSTQFSGLQEYLSAFTVLPVTEEIATLAGGYKATLHKIGLKDLIIAATAQLHKLTLVTANKKDFKGITTFKGIYIDHQEKPWVH
jgi:hypothetical protein